MSKKLEQAKLNYSLARASLVSRAPYIADTVYGLIPYFMEGMYDLVGSPIGVSEGMVLMMDVDWTASIKPEDFAGPLFHEVYHEVKEHLPRIKVLNDPETGNIAGDMTINPWLRTNKFWLPDWAIYPDLPKYNFRDDLTLEEYFEKLQKKSSGGKGNAACGGKCGGIAGNPLSKEIEAEVDQQMGRGEADKMRIRNITIQKINEYIKQNGTGSVPGEFEDLIPFEPKPSVTPWQEILQQVICNSFETIVKGSSDFSLRRPSKRSFTRGILRPGLIDYLPQLVIIEDTSGSMGTEEIQTARNEEISILQHIGVEECWLVQADVNLACDPQRINISSIPELLTHGRGGTDFRPALDAVQNLDPKPDLAIYLTDGYGQAPEHPPLGMEVIWVLVPQDGGTKPADWGTLVVVSDDPEIQARFE